MTGPKGFKPYSQLLREKAERKASVSDSPEVNHNRQKEIIVSVYTEGICADGAGILKDGELITIEQVLKDLNEARAGCGGVGLVNNLLNAIKDNEEVCILSGKEDSGGATEDRFRIEIAGPERLLKPLSDILFKNT